MKQLLVAALLVVGMTASAQDQKREPRKISEREQMTPEQRNELQLKKLTLDLGLDAKQQKEMSIILAEQSAKRAAEMAERKAMKEKGEKPTADQRFAKESKRLDEQIATKAKVKKILTAEQFKKWEEMRADRKEKMHKKMHNRNPKPENAK